MVPAGPPRVEWAWAAARVLLAALPAVGLGRPPAGVGAATQRGRVGDRSRRARRAPRRPVRPRLRGRRRRSRSGARPAPGRPFASSPRSCGGSSTRRARCATANSPHRRPNPRFRHDVNPPFCLLQTARRLRLEQTVRRDSGRRRPGVSSSSGSVCFRLRVAAFEADRTGWAGGSAAAQRLSGAAGVTPIIIVMSTRPHPTRKLSTYGED